MKKQYTAPRTVMVLAHSQQLMAASPVKKNDRYSSVVAEDNWNNISISKSESSTTFTHGQSSNGSGSRSKQNIWSEWDD